jgi:5-methylcytosine-specific restriction endonuclease McrBC regulatory subunit McrC
MDEKKDSTTNLSSTHWKEFAAELSKYGKKIGIEIEYNPDGSPTFKAGNKVGHLGFVTESGDKYNIVIEPKIPGSATGMLCALLGYNFDKAFDFENKPTSILDSPSSWIAAMYLEKLENFLNNIRPRGEEREEEFHGKVKGKIMVSQYLKRNYLTRRQIIPCRFVDWTMDNLPNQILNYALELSRKVISTNPNDVIRSKLGIARRCSIPLSGVTIVRISKEDFTKVNPLLSGSFMQYREIVELARILIYNIDPFAFDGELLEETPIVDVIERATKGNLTWDLVDMPQLFEKYLCHVTNGRSNSFRLESSNTNDWRVKNRILKPDCMFELDDETVVLDAKYKQLFDDNTFEPTTRDGENIIQMKEWGRWNSTDVLEEEIKNKPLSKSVSLNDVYQIISYATHSEILSEHVGLVYPANSFEASSTTPKLMNLGHFKNHENGIDVNLLTLRIDPEGIREEAKNQIFSQKIKQLID